MTFTRPPLTIWSEEDMCAIEIVPSPRRTAVRSQASSLRHEVTARSLPLVRPGIDEVTHASVIHAPAKRTHGNFIDASYRRILANPAWTRRLTKAHSSKRKARPIGPDEAIRAWHELDTATSSDALLMNIFCYPRVLASRRLQALLGIAADSPMHFGFKPGAPLARRLIDRTEIDLRLGDLLIEAKLTESDFQSAPMRLVERYLDFETVFDREALELTPTGVRSYQLIRGVLAAHALDTRFCVLCDRRRPDLIEAWHAIQRAVPSAVLRARLQLITWQEVAACLPPKLAGFLAAKYGIEPTTINYSRSKTSG